MTTVNAEDEKKDVSVVVIADSDDHESKSSLLSSQFSGHDHDSDSIRLCLSKIKKVKRFIDECFVKKIPFTERYVDISHCLTTNTNAVSNRELDNLECECLESLALEEEVSESSSNSEHSPNAKSYHHHIRKRDVQPESHTLMKHSHPPYTYNTQYNIPYPMESGYNAYQSMNQDISRKHSGGSSCYRASTQYYPSAQPPPSAHHFSYSSEREQPQRVYEYGETVSCGGSMRYSEQDMYPSYDHCNTQHRYLRPRFKTADHFKLHNNYLPSRNCHKKVIVFTFPEVQLQTHPVAVCTVTHSTLSMPTYKTHRIKLNTASSMANW